MLLPIDEARRLLSACRHGVLATHSQALPHYPFGSWVPYSLDGQGFPIILMSDLAQHYRNIVAEPKVSLSVIENHHDIQNAKRLTWVADAYAVAAEDESAIERYYKEFPESKGYTAMGFYFYRLVPIQIHYIGGFGKVVWYSPQEWVA